MEPLGLVDKDDLYEFVRPTFRMFLNALPMALIEHPLVIFKSEDRAVGIQSGHVVVASISMDVYPL
jgi:hypothetical protein